VTESETVAEIETEASQIVEIEPVRMMMSETANVMAFEVEEMVSVMMFATVTVAERRVDQSVEIVIVIVVAKREPGMVCVASRCLVFLMIVKM
jgi:hypothetical protein